MKAIACFEVARRVRNAPCPAPVTVANTTEKRDQASLSKFLFHNLRLIVTFAVDVEDDEGDAEEGLKDTLQNVQR